MRRGPECPQLLARIYRSGSISCLRSVQEVFLDFFIAAITGMIVLAVLRRFLRPSTVRAAPDQVVLPETLARGADGSVIDSASDARMRQAFNGLNSHLSFLGGQESWISARPRRSRSWRQTIQRQTSAGRSSWWILSR